jgi:hypothetical protein
VAGLGLAAKVMLGAGVAAAATTGAGAAGVLPTPVQHAFDHVVPGAEHDDHAVVAGGDHESHDTHEPPASTTSTTLKLTTGDDAHDHDTPVVVEPTTTTVVRHEEHHDNPTTTTTAPARHEEPTTTTTTVVVNHDGDNNNPESLHITCESAHEPNRIICHWTASTNPEHARYALLRINNQNTEGRVMTTTENGLEYTDTTVTSGWGYGYRVVSLRSDGTTESHSNIFTIPCC